MARYALVIGIANYNNFRNLPKAVTDAENIGRVLREHGRFEVQPLPAKLIEGENRWRVAPDKKLTGKELGLTLRKFLLEKAKNHEALIYFAGHGFEAPSLTGKQKGYLATFDCSSDGQNAIAFDDFNDLIRESQLASLVVLLDCCYAGSFLENSFLRSSFPVFNSKQDYCLISASREFERAREDVEGGIFTQAILRGLSHDKADEATGEVNVTDLFSFISRELKQSGQEPIYMGGGRSIPLVWYPPKNPVVVGVVREECPYRGLEAFDKQHAQFFFGRKKVVEDILQKLAQAQFVPIIGASGSGKSSVVRAGLIPQLEKNGWRVLDPMKPGIEPLAKLRAVFEPFFQRPKEMQQLYEFIHNHPDGLRSVIERLPGSQRFLLVVDQFEEVFTLCPKEEEKRRFIELLTQVVELSDATSLQSLRLAIVITMRADFLESCLSYLLLTQLIQNQAVYMPPLLGAELEQAIALPANLQGYRFEDGLLGEIMQDVGKEHGCLPLLQFALTELWEKRDSQKHQLTVEQYRAMGGVIGALDRHAENIYHSFTQQEQEWIKRIFLKLVRTGEEEKDTRQRQLKAKLLAIGDDNVISDVLDELIQGRLLVTGQEEQQEEAWVDLAHEALMEGWYRFDLWRKENRKLRRLTDRVEDALRIWQEEPKDENLMMGGLLAQVREKWQEMKSDLDPETRKFCQQSIEYEKYRLMQDSQKNQKLIELIEASRINSQFLTTIPHELRTPMNAIIGFSQLLLRPKVGELTRQQRDIVERIFNNGKHLQMLLNEMLDSSKLEAGRLDLKPEIFDLPNIIKATVQEMRSLAEQKDLCLSVQMNLQNLLVFNDPTRVRQILRNLLSNAIKFTESGSIGVELNELSENQLEIVVRDTGIGIAPDELQNIFEAFRQVDQSTTRKYPGTGLGLTITKSLVQLMQGIITVESQLAQGSTFRLELPRQVQAMPKSDRLER